MDNWQQNCDENGKLPERKMELNEELKITIDPVLIPVWQFWIGPENIAQKACEKTVQTVYSHERGYQYIKIYWKDLPESLKALKGRAKAQTSDVVRFWLLAKYGGVWFDSDIIARREIPFRKWLQENPKMVIHINHSVTDPQFASNGAMACNANNPAIIKCYEKAIEIYTKPGRIVWTGCGPHVLTNVMREGLVPEKPLPWNEWAHKWTNSGAQKHYQQKITPPVERVLDFEKNWYYIHTTGAPIKQHARRKSLKDGQTVFCWALKFVYNELGLELK